MEGAMLKNAFVKASYRARFALWQMRQRIFKIALAWKLCRRIESTPPRNVGILLSLWIMRLDIIKIKLGFSKVMESWIRLIVHRPLALCNTCWPSGDLFEMKPRRTVVASSLSVRVHPLDVGLRMTKMPNEKFDPFAWSNGRSRVIQSSVNTCTDAMREICSA